MGAAAAGASVLVEAKIVRADVTAVTDRQVRRTHHRAAALRQRGVTVQFQRTPVRDRQVPEHVLDVVAQPQRGREHKVRP